MPRTPAPSRRTSPRGRDAGGFLDFQRATLLWKLEGLDDEQLRRPMVPSGTSLLGMVKHLAYVERGGSSRSGPARRSPPLDREDPDADWRIEPDETTRTSWPCTGRVRPQP